MKEAFEKIIERLEEEALNVMLPDGFRSSCVPLDTIKHIVNQVAEEYVGKTDKFGNTERVNKHLDSLHEKILKSKFAEEVTEVEIDALVKAKNLNKFNQELNKPMIEHDGCKGCKYELEKEDSEYCTGCTQNAVDKYTR